MSTYENVENAIANGELWRAKEILRGRIADSGYDTELFERYGRVLLEMQDKLDAGKYLFLSAERKPEYAEPIELYLSRHKNGGLFHTFPKTVQKAQISTYPSAVIRDMKAMGQEMKPISDDTSPFDTEDGKRLVFKGGRFTGGFCLLFIFIFLIGTVSSFMRGLEIIFAWFVG